MKKDSLISWIALFFSIIACLIAYFDLDKGEEIATSSFIGLIASFIGACATFLVGSQIYNSIEFSRKIESINKLQSEILKDIEKLKKERNKIIYFTKYKSHITAGISSREHVLKAFVEFFGALKDALFLNDPLYINQSLRKIENVCRDIQKTNPFKSSTIFVCEKYAPEMLEKYGHYPLVRERYIKCYNILLDAYKAGKNITDTIS